jgi:hypothetical protein
MNNCNLQILFQFAEVWNSYMTVKVDDSEITPTDGEVYCYEKTITLPTKITLEFSGKNNNGDTIIDEAGNIVKDKCVIIKEIRLDNMPVEPLYLERRLKLEYGEQINYSNYIGFNGKMTIQFDKPDVFRQLMEWKRLGEY